MMPSVLSESGSGQNVAGDLHSDELVVRHVGVERLHDPVAVSPRIGAVFGSANPAGVERIAVAHEVEPVPAPSLAVRGRREQAIDKLLVGIRRLVRDERLDLLRRRRQAGQVERHAADERAFDGGLRRLQPGRFEFGEDERVDRVCSFGFWTLGILERPAKRPVISDSWRDRFRVRAGKRHVVRGTEVDPLRELREVSWRQLLPAVGHVRGLLVRREHVKQALLRVAGNDGRAVFATLQ